MNKSYIIGFLAIGLMACEEIGPNIDLGDDVVTSERLLTVNDTTFTASNVEAADDKVVVIEEFTGVQCSNCPQGTEKIKEIQDSYGKDKVLAVGLHSEFLAGPFSHSIQDLRSADAQAVSVQNGIPGSKPIAMVDRVVFPSESTVAVFRQKWDEYTQQRLLETPPVNIDVESAFDVEKGVVEVAVTMHYTNAVSDDHFLNVYLMENDIVTPQLMPDNSVNDTFNHKHVVREMLSSINGFALTGSKSAGHTVVKVFTTNLDPMWVTDNMEVAAMIRSSEEIVQGHLEHLGE